MQIRLTKISDSVTPQLENIIKAISSQGLRRTLVYGANKFVEMTKQNFGNQGRYREEQWPPLSEKYAKRIGRRNATLKVSNDLYNSIKIGAPRMNYIEIFTTNKYAAAHTFGSPKIKLPKRNFWPVQFKSPSYSRLLWTPEREMIIALSRQLHIVSNGALPILNYYATRGQFTYGNIFTGPQSPAE